MRKVEHTSNLPRFVPLRSVTPYSCMFGYMVVICISGLQSCVPGHSLHDDLSLSHLPSLLVFQDDPLRQLWPSFYRARGYHKSVLSVLLRGRWVASLYLLWTHYARAMSPLHPTHKGTREVLHGESLVHWPHSALVVFDPCISSFGRFIGTPGSRDATVAPGHDLSNPGSCC